MTTQAGRPQTPAAAGQARAGQLARPGGPPPGGAGLPQRERLSAAPAPAVHHDPAPRQPVPQVPPARGRHVRVPVGYSGHPGPADDTPQRWSAQLARTTGPIPQTYYDLAFGDGRLQVMLTETPGADPGWPPAPAARRRRAPAPQRGDRSAGRASVLGDRGPAMLARSGPTRSGWPSGSWPTPTSRRPRSGRRPPPRPLPSAKRRNRKPPKSSSRPPPRPPRIREAAEQEAAEIKQQAAAQVAAIREAAEREIAELRATVLAMSDELSRVAAYVTQNLATPGAPPAAVPAAAPAALPAGPGTRPARPAPGRQADQRSPPGTRPAKPAAKPTTKPASRQAKVMRKMAFAIAAVSVIGAISGTTELALHGGPFFILRANGAGAGETGPKEPVNPELPKKAGEVQCSLLHLACTLK